MACPEERRTFGELKIVMVDTPTQQPVAARGQNHEAPAAKPRLGFLGVGWIGRHRLAAAAESQCAEVAAIADACPEAVKSAQEHAPDAVVCNSFDQLLEQDLDGLVVGLVDQASDLFVDRLGHFLGVVLLFADLATQEEL